MNKFTNKKSLALPWFFEKTSVNSWKGYYQNHAL
jgi:hypothetical protein